VLCWKRLLSYSVPLMRTLALPKHLLAAIQSSTAVDLLHYGTNHRRGNGFEPNRAGYNRPLYAEILPALVSAGTRYGGLNQIPVFNRECDVRRRRPCVRYIDTPRRCEAVIDDVGLFRRSAPAPDIDACWLRANRIPGD